MYTNTSPEKIRETLTKAGIPPSSVRAIDAYPPLAATLFRAIIPKPDDCASWGVIHIMDRLKVFDALLKKSHRRASRRAYMYWSAHHNAMVVNIPIFLDRSAQNAE